jgi:hypothetical protein
METMLPPRGTGGFSNAKMNPSCLVPSFTIVVFCRLPLMYERAV